MNSDNRRSEAARQWANHHGLPPVQAFAAAVDAAIQPAEPASAPPPTDEPLSGLGS